MPRLWKPLAFLTVAAGFAATLLWDPDRPEPDGVPNAAGGVDAVRRGDARFAELAAIRERSPCPPQEPLGESTASILVVDDLGDPAKDALVHAAWLGDETRVPPDGLAVPVGVAGRTFTVHAPGFLPREGLTPAEGVCLVELDRGRTVDVRVVDLHAKPIEGVQVAVSSDCRLLAIQPFGFAPTATRPTPRHVTQMACTDADGSARISGLPIGGMLRFDASKPGHIRTSSETSIREGERSVEIQMARLAYAAATISCGDLIGWRTGPDAATPKHLAVLLSSVHGQLRGSLGESSLLWVGTLDESCPTPSRQFEVYSCSTGSLQVEAEVRPLTEEPIEVEQIVVEGCGKPPRDHGTLRIDVDGITTAEHGLRDGDLVLVPGSSQGNVWNLPLPLDADIALPAGSYSLYAEFTCLTDALVDIPRQLEITSGERRVAHIGVTRPVVDLMIRPRSTTGATLTSYALDVEVGEHAHSAMVLGRASYGLRAPTGIVQLSIRDFATGQLHVQSILVDSDTVFEPEFHR